LGKVKDVRVAGSSWDDIFARPEMRWGEPDWHVVGLVPMLHGRSVERVLDLGCGAGRHVVFLAREGFQVVGQDISAVALRLSRIALREAGVTAELVQHDMEEIPFPDDSFDAVISVVAIYHNALEGIKRSMAEVRRVLKPGGLFLVWFLSRRSYGVGEFELTAGQEIEPWTVKRGGDAPDAGMPHHFSDEAEVRDVLLSGFDILVLEESMQANRPAHWIALAIAPAREAG